MIKRNRQLSIYIPYNLSHFHHNYLDHQNTAQLYYSRLDRIM